jgi:hypothetical protein
MRFDDDVLQAVRKGLVIGIRAGKSTKHRFIAIWAVVVERRVFVRSWTMKADGWFETLMKEPVGTMQAAGREIPVRAVRTRSERLEKLVDEAYAEKYHTPGSKKYVQGFRRGKRRETTTELIPAAS